MKSMLIKSVLSGFLLALSWPVNGFSILIFIAFVPLLHLTFIKPPKNKLLLLSLIYLTFLIWNGATTWWLWNATAFGMFFAVFVNSLLMTGVFAIALYVDKKLPRKISLAFLASLWLCFEWLHLQWDFSWPWLQLGNVFSEQIYWIQWYEYTGVFGGSLWVWMINLTVFKGIQRSDRRLKRLFALTALGVSTPIIISLVIYHQYRIEDTDILHVVVAQPNVDPYDEKYSLTDAEQCTALFNLTDDTAKPIDLIIAPETYFSEGPGSHIKHFGKSPLLNQITNELQKHKTAQLLSGIQFYNTYTNEDKTATANKIDTNMWVDFYNSSFLSSNKEIQVYHKSKLVVGVETLPYRDIIEPLMGNIMIDLGGTVLSRATQPKRVAMKLDSGTKVGPVICYESIYGAFVTEYVREGAQFLAVMTNDAWWGNTPGHKQLLSYTRLRAIETRRPIARSANTGISAFINPFGEIEQALGYETKGSLKAEVRPQNKLTYYVRSGDFIARLALGISGFLFLFAIARKKT
jgi:apolipoprotein N-acyltransferase